MLLQQGEIVLIRLSFHQASGSKIRPALVLLDTGDADFVAAPITSQSGSAEFDLPITDWNLAGPNVASFVRIHKLAALTETDILRRLGRISGQDHEKLFNVL